MKQDSIKRKKKNIAQNILLRSARITQNFLAHLMLHIRWIDTGMSACVLVGDKEGCVLDSCQLVPKAGRHKVLHLVCKKTQRCKKSTEELWTKGKREKE